jgi:hypothetical protein
MHFATGIHAPDGEAIAFTIQPCCSSRCGISPVFYIIQATVP